MAALIIIETPGERARFAKTLIELKLPQIFPSHPSVLFGVAGAKMCSQLSKIGNPSQEFACYGIQDDPKHEKHPIYTLL
jgi:hypothetical protein